MNEPLDGRVRVLHVVGGMGRGGAETWLMHVLRNIDRERFGLDFLVHTAKPCAYDEEVRALGGRIIPCPNVSRPWIYVREFTRAIRIYGPYHVVHSHVHHFAGYTLWLADRAGVPVRIVHSHSDSSSQDSAAGFLRRVYLKLASQYIKRYATHGFGVSTKAGMALFGDGWGRDARWSQLPPGIDLAPFRTAPDPKAVREALGIPPDAFVIGHVGRFVEQKNHAFVVSAAAEAAARDPAVWLLLAGNGPLRPEIETRLAEAGLSDRAVIVGDRSDVPQLMMGAMDVLLFPSLYEGLPLTLVEAQAAGLACFISDVIAQEADLVKPLVHRLSLASPASVWADAVLAERPADRWARQPEALEQVENSSLNITCGVRQLERTYVEQLSS